MSQVYRVTLEGNVTRTIHVDDMMKHRVELSDILTKSEMDAILKKVLKQEGWVEKDGVFVEKEGTSDEEVIWDVDKGEVVAKRSVEKKLSIDVTVTGGSEDKSQARTQAEKLLASREKQAEQEIDAKQTLEQHLLSQQLQAAEEDRKKRINRVLQKVYKQAIQDKASQLGSVVSVEESQSGQDTRVVIRVEA